MTNHCSTTKRTLVAVLLMGMALAASVPAAGGDWLIRLRAISVDPDDSSSEVRSMGAAISGSGVSVDDDVVPELDITYMLNPNWGVELILATSDHDVSATGSLSGLGHIVDSKVLPPTLLLQYHFAPGANIRPYVGAGANFTLFYDESATASFEVAAGGPSNVDLDESFGLAGQLGLDIAINADWFLNLDVKYIDLNTTATITTPGPLGIVEVDVDINPFVWGIGIGRRF